MFTKEQFIRAIQHETRVCQHLYDKMPEGGLAYRPTPGQRSMLELIQYLTTTIFTTTKGIIRSDWSHIHSDMEKAKQMPADQFCAAMDRQCEDTVRFLQDVRESDLMNKESQTPMGPFKMGEALVLFPLKFIVAYRMQFFLYLKSAGASNLDTYNCWGGIDKPPLENPPH